jgi:hypothetical protein
MDAELADAWGQLAGFRLSEIELHAPQKFQKSSLLLLPARERKLRSLHLQPAAYRN